MKITAQDYIILAILEALEDSIQGKGLMLLCDVDYDLGMKNSWVKFTLKDCLGKLVGVLKNVNKAV